MFENIGSKIKVFAKVLFVLGVVSSAVTSISLCVLDDDLIVFGLITFPVGGVISWGFSAMIYGFGQLIDNSDKLVEKIAPEYSSTEAVNQKAAPEYVHKNWEDSIKALDDKELYDRSTNSDYTDKYRDMCVAELEKRAGNSANDMVFTSNQVNCSFEEFLAELQRYNISELELILKDQRQLYNGQELAAIEAELDKRRNMA